MASSERIFSERRPVAAEWSRGDDEVTIRDVWEAIVEGKWIIIIAALLTTAGATVWALVMTPIYRSEAVLAPRSAQNPASRLSALGGLASLAGIRVSANDDDKTRAIALLRSRGFAEQFIRSHNLLPKLFDDRWDAQKNDWSVESPDDIPTMRDAVRAFDDVRMVDEDNDTGLVTLGMEWKDPALAAEWAAAFVADLNAEMRRRAIADAEQSVHYLEGEASKTSIVELRQAIYGLIQDQIQSIMLANVQEQFAFEILDPPVVPEVDERVRPKRRLMVVLGMMLGVMLGAFVLFFRNVLRPVPREQPEL